MDALQVAHQLLLRDARHRVAKCVEAFKRHSSPGCMLDRFSNYPRFGVVRSVEELPLLKLDPHQHEYHGIGNTPLHYVDGDRVYYFPDRNPDGVTDFKASHLFQRAGVTYLPSTMLMRAIWHEAQKEEAKFPEILGMELVYADDIEQELSLLKSRGFHVRMAGYTPSDSVLGLSRLRATGFIAEFGFPGEEPSIVNTLEVSASLIQKIEGWEPISGDGNVVDIEDRKFLNGLKEMCYRIQKEHGSFAAKYAWETYKVTARYLVPEQEQEVS